MNKKKPLNNTLKNPVKRALTREDFAKWGKIGGLMNKRKGKKYFSEIGKLGADKRWENNKKK